MSFAALALGAAFGVMSGRGAFAGMIAAGVIPIVTGLFGGTRLSVSGPTGPMTAVSSVVIALAYDKFGGERLLAEQFITLVFMLTAAGLLLAGLLRTGRLIRFVPKTVILGFMSGIAMVIWVDQIKVLFGLDGKEAPTGTMHLNLAYSAITFLLILTLPKLLAKLNLPKRVAMFIPATLTSIIIMTVITTVFSIDIQHISLGAPVSSLGEFKQMMLSYLPTSRIMTQEHLLMAAPYALQLIMLGYLDSLLTALIMDHLTSKKSRLDKELVGQGLANGLSALLGGIPGAQATIRSVLLFKEGAHTRIGAMSAGGVHPARSGRLPQFHRAHHLGRLHRCALQGGIGRVREGIPHALRETALVHLAEAEHPDRLHHVHHAAHRVLRPQRGGDQRHHPALRVQAVLEDRRRGGQARKGCGGGAGQACQGMNPVPALFSALT
ncbi:MAG: SulP family inorganic anion transporter [Flavobacteriales bacterium]|nr:SulP family inorganic anion transporter [Flavobacteriales bacterium]